MMPKRSIMDFIDRKKIYLYLNYIPNVCPCQLYQSIPVNQSLIGNRFPVKKHKQDFLFLQKATFYHEYSCMDRDRGIIIYKYSCRE